MFTLSLISDDVNADKPLLTQHKQKRLTEALSSVEENDDSMLHEIIRKSDLGNSFCVFAKSLSKITVSQIPLQVLDSNLNSLEEEKAAIKGAILAKCDVISELCKNGYTFEVVYVKKFNQSVNAGVKVSTLIRNWVIRRGHLFIGNASCPVSDSIFIKQCFHCQNIGHVVKNCPAKSECAKCLFCAENHRSTDCSVKGDKTKHTCSNCLVTDCKTGSSNHTAKSFDCEHIQKEICRLQRKIEYGSKNVMKIRCLNVITTEKLDHSMPDPFATKYRLYWI